MHESDGIAAPKIHPATREMLPDDPLEMHGFELPGDPDLMLRILIEEYARIGWSTDAILQLTRTPEYQAFDGLRQVLGQQELERRIMQVMSRCGTLRVKEVETVPLSEQLVVLE